VLVTTVTLAIGVFVMLKTFAAALAAATLLLPTLVQAESLEVWGSTTCQKRFLEPGNAALKAATGVDVSVKGVGTGKGMVALIEGKSTVAAASSPLASAIKSAQKTLKKSGKTLAIPDNLQFHEIARDEIVPIVHKDNPVSSLSWQQLSDINTGKISNWKDVGGPDMKIRVITSHPGSATRAVFQKQVMNKAEYVKSAKKVNSTRREIGEVSKFKGAIGAVSAGFYKAKPGKTKIVQSDPISRPLALITIGAPSATVQKVIDFYRSDEGQKQIK